MKTTGLSRVSKDLIIADIEKELKARPAFFVAQHGTVSAPMLDQLRTKLRAANTRYFVVKNRLAKKALEKAKLEALAENFTGSCGIAFSGGDPVQPSKVLVEFEKANEVFKIRKGYVNGAVIGVDQIKVLASLPSREVLLARVVGGIQAPISKFVNVLAGTLRQVVTVLDAVAKKKAAN
jgi:large subunit ribosomal protein L10